MKALFRLWTLRLLALLFAGSVTFSQTFAQDRVPFRQEELDQMLAPIALYPDSLLSQVLMASTYPLEVVQAARWSRANPGLKGQDAVQAVEGMDWDPSIKSLVAFPQVLTVMDQKLEWTERLGEAFLAQQADVMDTVQGLRRRAEAAGNLRSTDQMRVTREGEIIAIEPPGPQVVYVPYYNPIVVYGSWWWPAYPPVFWAPSPAYYVVPAYGPAFYWGSGIVISAGFFFGHFDWPHRHVNVVYAHHHARPARVYSTWRHDPVHRRGVPFRNADARKRFEQSRIAETRRDADRRDALQIARTGDDSRTANIRQRRIEDRRNPSQVRREDERGNRPESASSRVRQGNDASRAIKRNDARARSLTPPETRSAQSDRGLRSERPAPQSNDRRVDAPRPQVRGPEPRSAAVAPVVRPAPRPAATAPTIRTETRQAPAGRPRAEARANSQPPRATPQQRPAARDIAPALRPAASVPSRAPRMESGRQGGDRGVRAHGNGKAERRQSGSRDNNS
jgi:hypothetical protein